MFKFFYFLESVLLVPGKINKIYTHKVYLNDEKHPIYFRCAIHRSTYTQKMVAKIIYILYPKSRDKLSYLSVVTWVEIHVVFE